MRVQHRLLGVFLFDYDVHTARLFDFKYRRVLDDLFFERPDVPVALAVARLYKTRAFGAVAERLANCAYGFSKRVVVDVLSVPVLVQQFLAGNDAVAVLNKIKQHLKRLVR